MQTPAHAAVAGIVALTGIASCAAPALGTGTGTVWGLKSQEAFAEPPTHLYHFAPDGSAFEDHGPIAIDGSTAVVIDGLAIDDAGALYAFELIGGGSRLVRVDDTTPGAASAVVVGPDLPSTVRGACFDATGALYGVDPEVGELVRIDPVDGLLIGAPLTLRLGCDVITSTATDIAQAPDGRMLVALRGEVQNVYRVDLATGRLQLTFSDPVLDDGFLVLFAGLAFADGDAADGNLFAYEVAIDDDIFTYNFNDAFARTERYADIIPGFNAGRGDLAAQVTVVGTPPPFPPRADLDGDGAVGVSDLLPVLAAWGACAGCPEDLDCSGAVDVGDLLILLAEWG